MPESDPYMRGLVVWIGFTQVIVPYERDARHAGTTHFPFFSRNPWKTFAMGMTSFSFMPIYVCVGAALAGLALTAALAVASVVLFATRSAHAGSVALLTLVLGLWATTMAAVASVGLYVIRVYKDVRGRPQFIVASAIGIEAGAKTREAARAAR
jgi:dolichol-phosphate mannosyltransferase